MSLYIRSVLLSVVLMSSFSTYASVADDVQSGQPLWKIVSNAKKAGIAPAEIASQMIQSGVPAINTVSATARAFPDEATEIVSMAVRLKPNMAINIEETAVSAVPDQKAEIALAVEQALNAEPEEVLTPAYEEEAGAEVEEAEEAEEVVEAEAEMEASVETEVETELEAESDASMEEVSSEPEAEAELEEEVEDKPAKKPKKRRGFKGR